MTRWILTVAATISLLAPGRPALAQQLVPVVAPDGSAIVSLPPGWTITGAFQGTLDIAGPQGQMLGLGAYAPMMGLAPDPAAGMLSYLRGQSFAIHPVILESTPVTPPLIAGGRSANVSMASELNGRRYKSLASITTAQTGYGSWMIYFSFAGAPAGRFDRDLPLMREIWNSWSVHPAVLRGRLDDARESRLETYRIWRETMDYRNRVYERANEAWDQVIRGVTTIEDTWTAGVGKWTWANRTGSCTGSIVLAIAIEPCRRGNNSRSDDLRRR